MAITVQGELARCDSAHRDQKASTMHILWLYGVTSTMRNSAENLLIAK